MASLNIISIYRWNSIQYHGEVTVIYHKQGYLVHYIWGLKLSRLEIQKKIGFVTYKPRCTKENDSGKWSWFYYISNREHTLISISLYCYSVFPSRQWNLLNGFNITLRFYYFIHVFWCYKGSILTRYR